ncbi:hypothetical protein ACVWXU_001391 [Streptomyces sp. TE33382]
MTGAKQPARASLVNRGRADGEQRRPFRGAHRAYALPEGVGESRLCPQPLDLVLADPWAPAARCGGHGDQPQMHRELELPAFHAQFLCGPARGDRDRRVIALLPARFLFVRAGDVRNGHAQPSPVRFEYSP